MTRLKTQYANFDHAIHIFRNYYLHTNEQTSSPFVIHDWPDTATVRKHSIGLKYTGDLEMITQSINAFNHVMVEGQDDITVVDIETGEPVADKYINLKKYQAFASPVCYKGKTC